MVYRSFALALLFAGASDAQLPVLNWSARLGPDSRGTRLLADDGSIFSVGNSLNGINLSKLSVDGSTVSCLLSIGTARARATALALGSGNQVWIAGLTNSQDFPFGNSDGSTSSLTRDRAFLIQINPCSKVVSTSITLPEPNHTVAIVVGPDSSVYVATATPKNQVSGQIYRFAPNTLTPEATLIVPAWPIKLAYSGKGALIMIGFSPSRLACLASYSPNLDRANFEVSFGHPGPTLASALALQPDGSVWVATQEGTATNPASDVHFSPEAPPGAIPSMNGGQAMLRRYSADGQVERIVPLEVPELNQSYYPQPTSLLWGPDRRLWCAIFEIRPYPRGAGWPPASNIEGTRLRSLDPDGNLLDEEMFLPDSFSVTGVDRAGNFIVSGPPALPATPGAYTTTSESSFNTLSFSLSASKSAPVLRSTRPILYLDEFILNRESFFSSLPATGLSSSSSAALPFLATLLPIDASRDGSQLDFGSATIPTSLTLRRSPFSSPQAVVILAQGAQGTLVLPVAERRHEVAWRVRTDSPLSLPAMSSDAFTTRLTVAVEEAPDQGFRPSVPFTIQSEAPWLKLDRNEGTTPAEFLATIDPTGLVTGTHDARLRLRRQDSTAGDASVESRIRLSVGPLLSSSSDPPDSYYVSRLAPHRHWVRFRSSGAPISLRLVKNVATPWMTIAPSSGETPLDIEVTIDPSGFSLDKDYLSGFSVLTASNSGYSHTLAYRALADTRILPGNLDFRADQAPGSRLEFDIGRARCDAAPMTSTPWPTTLGSCTVAINGRALPLGRVVETTLPPNRYGFFAPRYSLLVHLPYDLPLGPITMELTDKSGNQSTFKLRILNLFPVVESVIGAEKTSPYIRRAGETIVVRLSGLGQYAQVPPWGDVASGSIVPNFKPKVYVGGRSAEILSFELSRSEVGIAELVFRVPDLPPDSYRAVLLINETNLTLVNVRVPD